MTHQQAKTELERGTPAELICATCPWDRLCIEPPTLSEREYERMVKDAVAEDRERDPDGKKLPAGMLMTVAAFAGRTTAGQLCPVFALRLRGPDGRKVADGLREQMRTWGEVS